MTPPFRIKPLAGQDRSNFDCGSPALNHYLQRQAGQDIRRRVAACFVAGSARDGTIAGYYTLSACHVDLAVLDAAWAKRLPRYPTVPAARLGRLAIASAFQGQGLGAALLFDAAQRILASDIAAHLLVVDAKDDAAAAFYGKHGFVADATAPQVLYIPVATLAKLIDGS